MFDLLRLPLLQRAEVQTPESEEKMPPWNKGVAVGKKKPLTRGEVKRLYDMLAQVDDLRDLALFTLAIDSMLRSSDLLRLRTKDVQDSKKKVRERIQVMQGKTSRPVTCVLGKTTQKVIARWIAENAIPENDYLFEGKYAGKHLSRRRYQDIVKSWIALLGLPPEDYGTHSLRRTRASLLYSKTKDSAKVQIVLGQSTLTSAQEYLGVGNDDALESLSSIRLL